jgi:hypothetical protein
MVVTKSRKRAPNEEIVQHVSNKRKFVGLDTIPEDAKHKTFDTIPSHVKVDLFNSIVNTAFPNFNNLMIASWNVITIYTACGSDFPDLHKAIVDLKGVLQDFDESFGQHVDRAPPKYRDDFGGPSRDGRDGEDLFETHVPTLEQGRVGDSNQVGDITANKAAQVQEGIDEQLDGTEDSDGHDGEDDQVPPRDPDLALTTEDPSVVCRSGSYHMAETHVVGQEHAHHHHAHVKKNREQHVDDDDAEDRPLITLRSGSRRDAYSSSVERRRNEEPPVGKATPEATQNATSTKACSAEETDSHSELDQQTPQLQDGRTANPTFASTPQPRKKKQRDISSYTIVELETKYKEREAHILTTFKNDMSKVPEKHRKALESMNALLENRKKDEAQEKADKMSGSPKKIGRPGTSNGGMFGNYTGKSPSNHLGNSVLGAKKPAGIAPVAPMFPNGSRRDPRNGVAQGRTGNTPPYGRGN